MVKIKKKIILIPFIGILFFPLISFAALTIDQINAILNFLSVFNVQQNIINSVRNILLASAKVSTTMITNITSTPLKTDNALVNVTITPQQKMVAQQNNIIMPQTPKSIFEILPIKPEYDNFRFANNIDLSLLNYDNLKRLFDEGGGLIVWKSQKTNTYLLRWWTKDDPNNVNTFYQEGDWVLLYNPLYNEKIQVQLNSPSGSWEKDHPEAIQRLEEYLTKYPNAFIDPH